MAFKEEENFICHLVVQTVKIGSDDGGLCYQNDIASMYSTQKRKQNFTKDDIIAAISSMQSIIEEEENSCFVRCR